MNNIKLYIYALLFITFFCLQNANAQNELPNSNEKFRPNAAQKTALQSLSDSEKDKLIKIQHLLRAYDALDKFSGTAIIAKNGAALYKYTTGYASIDFKVNCALVTQFNTLKITQTFTALAIMQLAEQGKIDLNASFGNYLTDAPERTGSNITIHQLLTHTSGLQDYYDIFPFVYDILEKDDFDILNIALNEALLFDPGTKVLHSNTNYIVLATIVEKVANQSYVDYVTENIIQKAGLSDEAGLHEWYKPILFKAKGYVTEKKTSKLITAANFQDVFPLGSEALYASVEDLFAFNNAFQQGKLLGQKYRDLMIQAHEPFANEANIFKPTNCKEANAYGWITRTLENNKTLIYQGGTQEGLSTQLRYYTDDGFLVIVLSNMFDDRALEIAERIEQALYQDDYLVPNHPVAFHLNDNIQEYGIDSIGANLTAVVAQQSYELDRHSILSALGRGYMGLKKYDWAKKVYQWNLKHFPADPNNYKDLANCYLAMEDFEMATTYYKKRLAVVPGDMHAKKTLKRIAQQQEEATTTKPPMIMPGEKLSISDRATAPKTITDNANSTEIVSTSPTVIANKNTTKNNLTNPPINGTVTAKYPSTTSSVAPSTESNNKVHTVVDKMPEFPGGQVALFKHISDNLQYPQVAQDQNIQGTVYVKFVVLPNGQLNDITIDKGLKDGGMGCNDAALELVRQMPNWQAGEHQGKQVAVSYTVPVRFRKR